MKSTVSQPRAAPAGKDRQGRRPATRSALTATMARSVRSHYAGLALSSLQEYTFGRDGTDNSGADSVLEIFDGAGKLVFQGNEFQSGIAGYWRPSEVRLASGSAKKWGRQSLPGFVG
jgi:hypothetical protein